MPVTQDFKLPSSPKSLDLPEKAGQKLFLAFIASKDPVTKQSWCPDVRAALPVIEAKFSGDEFEVRFVEVGQRPEYVASRFLLDCGKAHSLYIKLTK